MFNIAIQTANQKIGYLLFLLLATTLISCGGGGGGSDTSNNKPVPISNAGPDQIAVAFSPVSLDGSKSSGIEESNTITYTWTFSSIPEGSFVNDTFLTDPYTAQPTFTPDSDGDFILSLIVNENAVNSIADTVTITTATPPLLREVIAGMKDELVINFSDGLLPSPITLIDATSIAPSVEFLGYSLCLPDDTQAEPIESATPPTSAYGCEHKVGSVSYSVATDKSSITLNLSIANFYADFSSGEATGYIRYFNEFPRVTLPLTFVTGNVYKLGNYDSSTNSWQGYVTSGGSDAVLGEALINSMDLLSDQLAIIFGDLISSEMNNAYPYITIP